MPSTLRRYTTDGIRAADTVEAWRRFLDEVYYGHDVVAHGDETIEGSLEKRIFAQVGLSRHHATAHTISRTAQLVKLDKVEQHVFVFPTTGIMSCRQSRHEIEVEPGSFYILNAAEPFDVRTSNGASSLALTIPSEISRLYVKGIDDMCCQTKAGEPAFVAALVAFMNSILSIGSKADGLWLRDISCSLLDAMLNMRAAPNGEQRWRTSLAARTLLIDAARKTITDRLQEKNFGAAEAANACHVSLRHLQNAFQSVGSTFRRELLNARLDRASRLLRSTARGPMQIAQIADSCGFGSASHFSTRYRQRYGVSPRDEAPPKTDERC